MGSITLKLIGNIAVTHDGEPQKLPPSKKTRALLAYLALNPRPFSREYLCELLWEIPDDPRGSLRWSLSKLRRLVDEEDLAHIEADRNSVTLNTNGLSIDVAELEGFAADLDSAGIDALIDAAGRFQGNFLEGFDFSNFHTFHAWCVSERERIAQLQGCILRTLVARLADDPERALPFARTLVSQSPYDEETRAQLITMLMRLGKSDEAEQQYKVGLKMLREIGRDSSDILRAAWRSPAAAAPAAPAPAPAPAVVRRTTGLIGREKETAQFAELLARPVQTPVIFLQGGIGMGKSHMLETAADQARNAGFRVLRAQAFESDVMRPFAVWADALAGVSDVFDQHDTANRERLLANLADAVAGLSTDTPLLLLLDDMQWCDESSAAALHHVARKTYEYPVLILAAQRSEEMRDNAALQRAQRDMKREHMCLEFPVTPLGEADICTILKTHFPDLAPERIAARCQGNPLYALELARAEDSGEISSLTDLIRTRLAHFSLEEVQVLQWAALLSTRITLERLAALSGVDALDVAEAMQKAEDFVIVEATDSGYQFTHNLLARGVYADIPPARRRIMHRRVAQAVEAQSSMALVDASDLAHHAAHSGDAHLAGRAMVVAGKECLRYFANDDALSLARRGLTWTQELPPEDKVELSIELNEIMMAAGPLEDWEAAADHYVRLAEQALDHGSVAHARIGYFMASFQRWSHGQWSGAREETLQLERISRGGTGTEHIIGLAETARCLAMLERDLSQADAMQMEARALASREHISHWAIDSAEGILRYHENRMDEARELFRNARTLCRAAGDRINEFQALEYLAMIEIEEQNRDTAPAACDALRDLGRRIREGSEGPFSETMRAFCTYVKEDDDTELLAALDELRIADAKHRLAYVLNRAAFVDLNRDRADRAIARASEALTCARLLQRDSETLMAHNALLRAGDTSADHIAAIHTLLQGPVALWARQRAEQALAESA